MSERSERHSTSWLLGSAAHYTTWWGGVGWEELLWEVPGQSVLSGEGFGK